MSASVARCYAQRFGLAEGEAPALDAGLAPGGEAALERILSRSGCRRFRGDPVPEALLATVLACAQSAPSKSDLQQYSVIRVEAAQSRREIAAWLPAMPWVGEAPVFLVFCGDVRRNRRLCEQWQRPHANDNVDTFLNATVDCALALGTFIVAAEAAGLGCCPISYVRNHLEGITELLGLPEGVFPVAGLCVGFPLQAERLSMRLPPAVVIHRDRYRDDDLGAQVSAYDQRRAEREPILPAKQKNARRYGITERGSWSDQVSRQLSLPERADFRAYLQRQGLTLA